MPEGKETVLLLYLEGFLGEREVHANIASYDEEQKGICQIYRPLILGTFNLQVWRSIKKKG